MMIKIFAQGNDGKIALTPEELRSLLDVAYWEGYKANCKTVTNGTELTETVFVGDAKMEVNT